MKLTQLAVVATLLGVAATSQSFPLDHSHFWYDSSTDKPLTKCEPGFDTLKCAGAESNTLVGAAVAVDPFYNDPQYLETLAEHFSYITPENATKWGLLTNKPFRYNFDNADALIDFALENDMKVKGHAFLWHRELPSFVTEDISARKLKTLTAYHIFRTARHFKGRVYAWDVVNEAIEDDGSMRDSILLQKLGPKYVERAFRLARFADRRAKLFYNDFSIAYLNAKSDAVYAMAKDFVERGVPIDGIGFQMHFAAGTEPSDQEILTNFQRFIDLGLSVNISELDIRVADVPGSMERKLKVQKAIYQRFANICQQLPKCDGMTTWGFTDKYSWIDNEFGEDDPLQFDEQFGKKPAFFGQFDGLLGLPPLDPNFGDNLLPNPGFEDGTNFWFSFGASLSTSSSPVRSGLASALVSDRNESFQPVAIDATGLVVPGSTYKGVAWARIDGAASDNALLTGKIVCEGSENQFITIAAAQINDSDWTEVSGTIDIPDCNLTQFLMYLEGPAPGVNLLADDMELRREETGFGDNVLSNSSFEDGTGPFFPLAGTLTASDEQANSGGFSAKLAERFDTWNGVATDVLSLVSADAGFNVTAYARVGGSSAENAILTLKTVCEGEEPQFTPLASGTASDASWLRLQGAFVAPSCNLTEVLLYVEGPAAGVDLYVDDFEMAPEV